MKTLPNSQATFLDETEFPLTSSREDSRAKILAALESKQASAKAHEAASGPKSSDLLASYHPATSSWRTSQHCLVAQANNEGDGLAEYSETWPSAGMMRNGKTYQRQAWALPTVAKGSGLLPTPRSIDGRSAGAGTSDSCLLRRHSSGFGVNLAEHVQMEVRNLWPTPTSTMHKGSSQAALTRKSGKGRSRDRLDHCLQSLEGSGALNPTWVEWLMGFPSGHTDLKD
jgi:hypothetical protein